MSEELQRVTDAAKALQDALSACGGLFDVQVESFRVTSMVDLRDRYAYSVRIDRTERVCP